MRRVQLHILNSILYSVIELGDYPLLNLLPQRLTKSINNVIKKSRTKWMVLHEQSTILCDVSMSSNAW